MNEKVFKKATEYEKHKYLEYEINVWSGILYTIIAGAILVLSTNKFIQVVTSILILTGIFALWYTLYKQHKLVNNIKLR